jgi:hypothetical protein
MFYTMERIKHDLFGECVALQNQNIRAVISPTFGLSLIDLCFQDIPILDRSREQAFLESRKGLGPLILPHFNQRESLPEVDFEAFEHVPYLRKMNVRDPFQHGVGRYAAWRYRADQDSVTGSLTSSDRIQGYEIAEITGFAFQVEVCYRITETGLNIHFDLNAEQPVEAGIHFYYDLKNRHTAVVELPVEGQSETAVFHFDRGHDTTYIPSKTNRFATYTLTTDRYVLRTIVPVLGNPSNTFDAVTLFSPEEERFVCIEPLSFSQQGRNETHRFQSSISLELNMPRRLTS